MEKESLKDVMVRSVRDFTKYLRSRRYNRNTLRQYTYTFGVLTAFLTERGVSGLQDVVPEDLEAFDRHLKRRGLSVGSRDNLMRNTRSLFRWLVAGGRVFMDPVANMVLPKRAKGLITVPTEEEMTKLLAQPDTTRPIGIRDRALMEVAYGCGLRRSELAGLSVNDPNLEQGTLLVHGKNGKDRVVPLGKQAAHWLEVYLKEARPRLLKDIAGETKLWITEQSTPMGGFSMRQQVRYYVEHAGIRTPMNLHSLRKACATHMLSHGAHPVDIQMLLGHANLKHLGQYLSVTIHELKKSHTLSKPGQ